MKLERTIDISGSQLELMLQKNEAKAQELTLTWIDKWNNNENENVISLNIDFKNKLQIILNS